MFSKGVVDTLSARKEGIPHATTGTEHIERHEVTPTKGNAKDIRLIQVKKAEVVYQNTMIYYLC